MTCPQTRKPCRSKSCRREQRCLDQPDSGPVAAVPPGQGPKLLTFVPPAPETSDQMTPGQLLEDLLACAKRGEYDPAALIVVGVFDRGTGWEFDRACAGPQTTAETHFWLTLAARRVLDESET